MFIVFKNFFSENSLIIIGKISSISDYDCKKHGELSEIANSKFMVVDLEKIEYMIGFYNEDLVLRNYLVS